MIENPFIEEALIGSVLKNPEQLSGLSHVVPDDFAHIPFRDAWRAFLTLKERGVQIDAVTVGDELERTGGLVEFTTSNNHHAGRVALSMLADYGEPENAGSYAAQVQDYAAKRTLLEICTSGVNHAMNGRQSSDIQADLLKQISGVRTPHRALSRSQTLAEVVSDAYDKTDKASRGETLCVPTGFVDLDGHLNGGLRSPQLVIVAGRPGMGKTALKLSIAFNAIKAGKRGAFFSLEMNNDELGMRLIAMESGIEFGKQESGRMSESEWAKYIKAVDALAAADYPLILNDLPAITNGAIRRELNRIGKVDFLVVDYLQLQGVEGKYASRVQEVGEISAGLKALAKEFDIPVLVGAQLNRAVEQRADKRPYLSDLRESGSIENDADIVMFIHRPDQYDKEAVKNMAEIIIAKRRNGPVGTVELAFRPQLARFENAATFSPNE